MPTPAKTLVALLPLALLALAAWALAPGASGGFLFDDFVNLPALGEFGRIDTLPAFAYYLTTGLGDPIGRPLSLLSFLIDARDWPAPAQPFLHTNILLHLLNGQLLALVLLHLARARGDNRRRAEAAALFGAGLWLLHPLFLSTTLYIVQRESMLAASFVLLGFLAWLGGRARVERGATRSGLALLAAGSLGCTALAMLCKANGALLPMLLLVAEATVLPPMQGVATRAFTRARGILLLAPTLLVAIYLIATVPAAIQSAHELRPWTLGERLLTEPRVIADYLRLLLLPRPLSNGLFRDDFAISTSLWHPWTTLPAIALLGGLALLAWRQRRRWPRVAFATLFFLAGHALEGSVVPLELYFEHRNYLPAMPLFWPLAVWLTSTGRMTFVRHAAAFLIVLLLAADTRVGATIWGQPDRLAYEWASRSPNSPRAQATAAQYEMGHGAFDAAQARLVAALARHPDEAQLAFNLADADCARGGLQASAIAAMQRGLRDSRNTARLSFDWLSNAVARAQRHECAGLDLEVLEQLLGVLRANPHFADASGRQQDFDYIEGLVDLARKQPDAALDAFDRALALLPQPQIALTQAALLGGAGRPDLGLRHLDAFAALPAPSVSFGRSPAQLHRWLLDHYDYWRNELTRMRRVLADDMQRQQNEGPPGDAAPR